MDVLDLAEPQRWPKGPRVVVEQVAAEVATRIDEVEDEPLDPDKYGEPNALGFPACDLPSLDYDYSEQVEARLRSALGGGQLLAAFHATRLLPHEHEWIRAEGLRVLTDDLVAEKLLRAAEAHPGLLTADESALLCRSGPCDWQETRSGRIGLLHVAAPFSILVDQASGIRPLIRAWGGEAIGWTDDDQAADLVSRFTARSVPSIIELAVAIGEVPATKPLWPGRCRLPARTPARRNRMGTAGVARAGPDRRYSPPKRPSLARGTLRLLSAQRRLGSFPGGRDSPIPIGIPEFSESV